MRRVSWTIGDQALWALSNLAIGIFAARLLTATEFGAFSLGYTVLFLSSGVSRAAVSEPLIVKHETAAGAGRPPEESLAAAALLGAVIGVPLLGLALLLPGPAGRCFLVLAILHPIFTFQDAIRYVCFATGRAKTACTVDGLWLLGVIAAAPMLALRPSAVTAMVVWAASAGVAAVYGVTTLGLWGRVRGARRWLRQQRAMSWRFAVEFMAQSGGTQVPLWIATAVVGLEAAASLRGVQLLYGPLRVLFMALPTVVIPFAARSLRSGTEGLEARLLVLGAALASGAAVLTVGLLAVPSSIGAEILGDTWEGARPLVLPIGLSWCAIGLGAASLAGLRALQAINRSLVVRLYLFATTVIIGAVGALAWGARGAAWAAAVASAHNGAVWYLALRGALRSARASTERTEVDHRVVPRPLG